MCRMYNVDVVEMDRCSTGKLAAVLRVVKRRHSTQISRLEGT